VSVRATTGTFVTGGSARVSTVFFLFACGAAVALLIHSHFLFGAVKARFPHFSRAVLRPEWAAWFASSTKLWIGNVLDAAHQYLDVIIIAYLMKPAVAGAYFIIIRIANVFATGTDALHMYSSRLIPEFYFRHEKEKLSSLLNSVAIATLAIVTLGMLCIAMFGGFVLSMISEEYAAYFVALLVLSCGTAAVAASGPSAAVLMLTGHEGQYSLALAASVMIRVAGFFALIPSFGIWGAVATTVVSFIFLAAVLRWLTTTRVGLDASVVRLATVRGR
jgi:O-antigen/teichoic acid export membrane protein